MNSCLNRQLVLVFLFGIMSAFAVWAGDTGWGKISDEEWRQGPPADLPEANAVVLHDLCTLTVNLSGIEMSRWVRMKLFNKAGAEEIGDAGFLYRDGDKIRDLKAQTITPGGKTLKLESKDFFTKSVAGYMERTFAFPGLDSGCIVEYHYRNVNERFLWLDPWYFQSNLYTLKSSFTLVIGAGFTYSSSWVNVPSSRRQPKSGEIPNADTPLRPYKTFTWELNNLQPITEEPYMSARQDYLASMYYQLVSYKGTYEDYNYIKGWQDLGRTYEKGLVQFRRGGDLDDLSGTITAGAATPEEKVRRIYAYVTRDIQTKSAADIGAFGNDDYGALRKSGAGTGQEKNLLLTDLLKRAGIQSWPVLISTRDHRRFNPEIYQTQQFNYLISFVQLDSSAMFLDASSKFCSFGMLPPDCLVEAGFLIDGDSSQLVRVLRNEPKTYRLDVTNMRLDSTGSVRCSTTSSMSGYFAPDYGALTEKYAKDEFLKTYFLDKLDATYSLDSSDIALDSSNRCVVTAAYTLTDYARTLDNNLTLKPVAYMYRTNPFKRAKRSFPVDFNYAFTYHNMAIITGDRPITSALLPRDTTIEFQGVTFHRAAQFADGRVQIDDKLTVTNPVFLPSQYQGLKQLFDAVAQLQDESVVLKAQ